MSSQTVEGKKTAEKKLEVRLAQNQFEIEQTLSLRYRVFNEEMGEGLPDSEESKKDRDEYDQYCDHLIVIDQNRDNMIVGTYRLLRGSIAKENIGFYSESEFDLSNHYNLDGEVAELGRSCVHPDYRDGSVINMLWTGLAWYVKHFQVRYLMGCGSVHSTDVDTASKSFAFFKEKNALADQKLWAIPLESHRMAGFNPELKVENIKEISRDVPSLLKGYIRAGARIASEPALDAVFGVTDFFVIFDAKEITERYGKHYLGRE